MENNVNLGDGNKVAQPTQEMVATENVMKVFKVTGKILEMASMADDAYLDLSSDGAISIKASQNNSDIIVYVSNYHTLRLPNELEKINNFIDEGLFWLVETWHAYKSFKDCGEYWEVELYGKHKVKPSIDNTNTKKRVTFIMEHNVSAYGRTNYKMHLFDSLNEAKEFRAYLFRHCLSKLPLNADFEYKYIEEHDIYKLVYEDGWAIDEFNINQQEIDDAEDSYTLSFKERAMMDDKCIHDPENGLYIECYNEFN